MTGNKGDHVLCTTVYMENGDSISDSPLIDKSVPVWIFLGLTALQ